MNEDTFWSDTMMACLSDAVESSVEGPYHVVGEIAKHLRSIGLVVARIEESHKGTKNINPRREVFIEVGASQETLDSIEQFLTANGVNFTKHVTVSDSDHLDFSYDLTNISVWRNDA